MGTFQIDSFYHSTTKNLRICIAKFSLQLNITTSVTVCYIMIYTTSAQQ